MNNNPIEAVRMYLARLFQDLNQNGQTGAVNRVVNRVIGREPLPEYKPYDPLVAAANGEGPGFTEPMMQPKGVGSNPGSPAPTPTVGKFAPPIFVKGDGQPVSSPMPVPSPTSQQQNMATIEGFNPERGQIDPSMAAFITKAASTYGIDPALLSAVLFNESGIKPLGPESDNVNYDDYGRALSRDRGIAQINSAAHPEIDDSKAYDPSFAVDFAAKKLSGDISHFGPSNIDLGIIAYNMGRTGTKNTLGSTKAGRQYQQRVWRNLTPDKAYQLGMATPSGTLK